MLFWEDLQFINTFFYIIQQQINPSISNSVLSSEENFITFKFETMTEQIANAMLSISFDQTNNYKGVRCKHRLGLTSQLRHTCEVIQN